jgi:hypothetical protein
MVFLFWLCLAVAAVVVPFCFNYSGGPDDVWTAIGMVVVAVAAFRGMGAEIRNYWHRWRK